MGGCGHLTAGGVVDVEAYLSDNDPEFPAQVTRDGPTAWEACPSHSWAGNVIQLDSHRPQRIQGSLSVRVLLEVQDAEGTWFRLTEEPQEITVSLEGTSQPEIGRTVLSDGRYTAVRAAFGRVEADVTRGLDVDGSPIIGRVPVQIPGGGRLLVVHSMDRTLRDGDRLEILVALNAQAWLRAANAQLRSVPEAPFRNAVRIRVR